MPVYNVAVNVFDEYADDLDPAWLIAIAQVVMSVERLENGASTSIAIADDETVAWLNSEHRGLDGTTDVLSFSPTHSGAYYGDDRRDDWGVDERDAGMDEFEFILPPDHAETNIGEVVISLPQARRQATEAGHPLANEIAALLAHGIYHLLGYDHEGEDDAERMRPRERAAMGAIRDAGLIE